MFTLILIVTIWILPGYLSSTINYVTLPNNVINDTDPLYWFIQARKCIQQRQETIVSLKNIPAKNIILFIGDGMGISTMTGARVLKQQQINHSINDHSVLEWDQFPYSALVQTYNVDQQIPESAGAATAFLSGTKVRFKTLGVSAKVHYNEANCDLIEQHSIDSIFSWALKSGKGVGVVSTARITHATPAASYAHTQNRKWESNIDEKIVNNNDKCKDIALQLIENDPGKRFNVILGGGRRSFLPNTVKDPKDTSKAKYGSRVDGRNLIEQWLVNQRQSGLNESEYAFVNSTKGLRELDYLKVKNLFGLFNHTHMNFNAFRDQSLDGEPSLTEMTEAAILILSKYPNGFLLLVEGGLIDQAHHGGYAMLALLETLELNRAVATARRLVSTKDTLIITTADHSQPLVINGYADRNNPINGVAKQKDNYHLPYTTMMYTNGPGFQTVEQRIKMAQSLNQSLSKYKPIKI